MVSRGDLIKDAVILDLDCEWWMNFRTDGGAAKQLFDETIRWIDRLPANLNGLEQAADDAGKAVLKLVAPEVPAVVKETAKFSLRMLEMPLFMLSAVFEADGNDLPPGFIYQIDANSGKIVLAPAPIFNPQDPNPLRDRFPATIAPKYTHVPGEESAGVPGRQEKGSETSEQPHPHAAPHVGDREQPRRKVAVGVPGPESHPGRKDPAHPNAPVRAMPVRTRPISDMAPTSAADQPKASDANAAAPQATNQSFTRNESEKTVKKDGEKAANAHERWEEKNPKAAAAFNARAALQPANSQYPDPPRTPPPASTGLYFYKRFMADWVRWEQHAVERTVPLIGPAGPETRMPVDATQPERMTVEQVRERQGELRQILANYEAGMEQAKKPLEQLSTEQKQEIKAEIVSLIDSLKQARAEAVQANDPASAPPDSRIGQLHQLGQFGYLANPKMPDLPDIFADEAPAPNEPPLPDGKPRPPRPKPDGPGAFDLPSLFGLDENLDPLPEFGTSELPSRPAEPTESKTPPAKDLVSAPQGGGIFDFSKLIKLLTRDLERVEASVTATASAPALNVAEHQARRVALLMEAEKEWEHRKPNGLMLLTPAVDAQRKARAEHLSRAAEFPKTKEEQTNADITAYEAAGLKANLLERTTMDKDSELRLEHMNGYYTRLRRMDRLAGFKVSQLPPVKTSLASPDLSATELQEAKQIEGAYWEFISTRTSLTPQQLSAAASNDSSGIFAKYVLLRARDPAVGLPKSADEQADVEVEVLHFIQRSTVLTVEITPAREAAAREAAPAVYEALSGVYDAIRHQREARAQAGPAQAEQVKGVAGPITTPAAAQEPGAPAANPAEVRLANVLEHQQKRIQVLMDGELVWERTRPPRQWPGTPESRARDRAERTARAELPATVEQQRSADIAAFVASGPKATREQLSQLASESEKHLAHMQRSYMNVRRMDREAGFKISMLPKEAEKPASPTSASDLTTDEQKEVELIAQTYRATLDSLKGGDPGVRDMGDIIGRLIVKRARDPKVGFPTNVKEQSDAIVAMLKSMRKGSTSALTPAMMQHARTTAESTFTMLESTYKTIVEQRAVRAASESASPRKD